MRRGALTLAALLAADALALVLALPAVPKVLAHLGHPRLWLARDGADGACAQLAVAAIWVVAAWLALGLLATAAIRLPGAAGAVAARIARLVLPRAVRGLLAGSAGLGVLLAPVAAGAVTGPPAGAIASAQLAALPAPSWPLDQPAAHRAPRAAHTQAPVPTPRWPTTGSAAAPPARHPPAHRPPKPAASPAPRSTPHRPDTGPGATVTVEPGDSLWLIAARRIGHDATAAQIAAQWPRWYAANRRVIGDDPAALTPGQVLHAPADPGKENS